MCEPGFDANTLSLPDTELSAKWLEFAKPELERFQDELQEVHERHAANMETLYKQFFRREGGDCECNE